MIYSSKIFKENFSIEKNSKEKYNYKNPIIPEGFHTASWEKQEDGAIKGWNNGLVIEDDKGNQFVWVPCTVEDNVVCVNL